MRQRPGPLPRLIGDQKLAAEPIAHAALSASAGTGKTQVLTARVLRLLLSDVRPENILCLTFTKAGAAEMANRLNARLASWVRMKDANLSADLIALGEDHGEQMRERARRLFARILDAPGGLRIQTIHSFAQTLLASFPVEAGVPAGLEPLEGRAQQELARNTLAELLATAEQSADQSLIADVQTLSLRLGEGDAVSYLLQCAEAGDAMQALGPSSDIEAQLRTAMGLPDCDVDEFLAAECADDRFDCALLRAIAATNRNWGGKQGLGHADAVDRWLSLSAPERAAALQTLRKVVLTEKDTVRVSDGQRKQDPDYPANAERLAEAVRTLLQIQRGCQLASDMAAGLRAGQAFAGAYSTAKRAAGVADFSDLIRWTKTLLETPGMGDWVRFKLDRRTDHILVDEAQDTNRDQWDIIKALAGEYFSGSSESEARVRTIFMVGDFKQAIYGFQGSKPAEFLAARKWVAEQADALRAAQEDAGPHEMQALEFRDLSIDASFRSAPAVLDVVDALVGQVGFRALGLEAPPNRHDAHFADRPGTVELWPLYDPPELGSDDTGEEGWLDERERKYAQAIADQVRDWLSEAPILATTKRPLAAGDILILVRRRRELASLIVARLFAAGVPVAGIDRLHLSKPFAVRDMLAAVAFAVQPLDDLNLGNLLVSPLIGWNQQQLFDLAFDRGASSLWRRLRERSADREDFKQAHAALGDLLAMADYTTPFRFLETILSGPIDGRLKLYARLGMAARDPLDELLSSALEFERNETPSLDRFLAWFDRGDVEIQRDASGPAKAVRVMTVHGAKGLEAPYVIIADAAADPARLGGPGRTLAFPVRQAGEVPVIRPRSAERVAPFDTLVAEEQASDLEEHWRLLYVGLTRAAERLVVAALKPSEERKEASWHAQVEQAMVALGAEEETDPRWGQTLRWRGRSTGSQPRAKAPAIALEPWTVPGWALRPAPPESRPPRPLAPSAMETDRELAFSPGPEQQRAAERGIWIHRLLERLPEVAEADRRQAALTWLDRSAGLESRSEREAIAHQVCDILSDERFAEVFGEGSLAEAPIAATISDGRVIAGTVDRLQVTAEKVLVVDFKTGRAPSTEADIPSAHRSQMAAYREALSVIFPGRTVRAALLYTAEAKLIELAA